MNDEVNNIGERTQEEEKPKVDNHLTPKMEELEKSIEATEELSVPIENLIDRDSAFNLYAKVQKPAAEGNRSRIRQQFTIRPSTLSAWRDFLETQSGSVPQRGKGISSAMIELSMRITMAIIADFEIEIVGDEIASILSHKNTSSLIANNINQLAFAVFTEKSCDCDDADCNCS